MAISLLQYAEEICEKTFAMSRNKMRSSKDFTEQEMAKVEETDNAIMNDWRSECVEKFFSFYPKNVVKNLPFKTWDEAILWARRFEKEKKL